MWNVILVKIYVCFESAEQLSMPPNFALTKHDQNNFNHILLSTKTNLSNMHVEPYYQK
jgi:hypothetical protein